MTTKLPSWQLLVSLQWRHNERDGVSYRRRLDWLFVQPFVQAQLKKSKLCATGLCEGNPPVTGGFPSRRASNSEMLPFDAVIMFRCSCIARSRLVSWLEKITIPFTCVQIMVTWIKTLLHIIYAARHLIGPISSLVLMPYSHLRRRDIYFANQLQLISRSNLIIKVRYRGA